MPLLGLQVVLPLSPPEYAVAVSVAALASTGLIAPLFGATAARRALYISTLISLLSSLYLYAVSLPHPVRLFGGVIVVDSFTSFLLAAVSVITLLAGYAGAGVVERWRVGEAYYAILALNVLGVSAIAFAGNEILVYAAWILAAVSSYVIVALRKTRVAVEAAVKYAMMGIIATALIVFALGVNTFLTGSIDIAPYHAVISPLLEAVLVFLTLTAVGFKMGVVPFHFWLPDVYGNARPLLVAVVASAAKILAIAFILKLLTAAAHSAPTVLLGIAGVLAVVTMFYGNIGALRARTPQHVLAYSAIAQAGYLLVGVAALAALPSSVWRLAAAGILLHVLGYAFAKAAAFMSLDVVKGEEPGPVTWEELRGFARRCPVAGAGLLLALASLIGVPPTLGFWGKLLIALAVAPVSPVLALLLAVNAAIGSYYYGLLMYRSVAGEGGEARPVDRRGLAALALALLTLLMGLYPLFAFTVSLSGF